MLYVRRGSNCAFAADFFLPKEFSLACKREGFWEWRKGGFLRFNWGVRMHRMVLRRRGRVPKAGERSETYRQRALEGRFSEGMKQARGICRGVES